MRLTAGYGDDKCKCSLTSCSIIKKAYYYLYPFNIEYSLFASAMTYILWKNVGRVMDEHCHHHIKFRLKDIVFGPVVGVLLVIAGLATFIIYEIEMLNEDSDEESKDKALMMYFVMNIVIVVLMSVTTVIGCAVFKVDHREQVSDKNPTRNLDVGLLVGASLGQFIISYFSIIATIGAGAKGHLNRLNLTGAILMVIQLGLQNFFIIEGLHRKPFHEAQPTPTVVVNPYVLEPKRDLGSLGGSHTTVDPALAEPSLHSHTAEHKPKLLWKRRVLKEVCAFLLLCNIIVSTVLSHVLGLIPPHTFLQLSILFSCHFSSQLWIMPAFGARPQFDHQTESDFYNFNMWATVVNIGLPFGIFYRMHSVASLFEVYLTS